MKTVAGDSLLSPAYQAGLTLQVRRPGRHREASEDFEWWVSVVPLNGLKGNSACEIAASWRVPFDNNCEGGAPVREQKESFS